MRYSNLDDLAYADENPLFLSYVLDLRKILSKCQALDRAKWVLTEITLRAEWREDKEVLGGSSVPKVAPFRSIPLLPSEAVEQLRQAHTGPRQLFRSVRPIRFEVI